MKSSMAQVERCETGYKAKLLAVKKLITRRRAGSHEMATLLVSVFNDRNFRADLGNVDDFKAADALDEYCEGMDGLRFLQVRALLEHYPSKSQWEGRRLSDLYAEMRESQRAEVNGERPKREVNRVTREQYEAVQTEKQHAEARAKFLDTELSQRQNRLSQLEKENADLKQDLAKAMGRIEELERQLARRGS